MFQLDGFQCRACGRWHEGLPHDYGFDAPDYWSDNLTSEPGCFLNSDLCVLRNKDYFVRGVIGIPIIGSDEVFRFGVWVSLNKENFDRMVELDGDPKLLEEPPYFGWLSNSIRLYPQTLNLKTNVRFRALNLRPYIELEPTEHPLSADQRHGITVERVRDIAEAILHGPQIVN